MSGRTDVYPMPYILNGFVFHGIQPDLLPVFMPCATVKPIGREFLFVLFSCNFGHRISRILLWNCFLVRRIDFNAFQRFSRGLSARACSSGDPVVCTCSLLLGCALMRAERMKTLLNGC